MHTSLDLVRCLMTSWGWSDGGDPGSVKRDARNKVIARHGDATWATDVESACVRLRKLAESPSGETLLKQKH